MSGTHDEVLKRMHQMRGVRNPCPQCQGMGVVCYGSGATWRGGMGTASFEWAECDVCWGSGDEHRRGMDLRKLEATFDERVKQGAADLLRMRTGLFLSSLQAGGLEVADELEKFERQRRARPHGFHTVASCLAKVLREIVEASAKPVAP